MEERQIVEAIQKARKGISQYLEIMELFPKVDVADNGDFHLKTRLLTKKLTLEK